MKKETFEEYTEDYKPSFVDLADTLPEQETIEEVNPFKLPKALPDDVFYESLKPKQETLEEACLNYSTDMLGSFYEEVERAFAKGAKWQQERSYSEQDLKEAFKDGYSLGFRDFIFEVNLKQENSDEWFKLFINK